MQQFRNFNKGKP